MSNSEEEEEEDDESSHSSSSDTLTCSIPEVNLKHNYSLGTHVSGASFCGFPSKMSQRAERKCLVVILYILEWNSEFLGTLPPVLFPPFIPVSSCGAEACSRFCMLIRSCVTGSVLFTEKSTPTLSDAAAWNVLLLGNLSFLFICVCMDLICVYVFIRHITGPRRATHLKGFCWNGVAAKGEGELCFSCSLYIFWCSVVSLWSVQWEKRLICLSGTREFGSVSFWSGDELWSCWTGAFICEAGARYHRLWI